jgi:hypothetical protein
MARSRLVWTCLNSKYAYQMSQTRWMDFHCPSPPSVFPFMLLVLRSLWFQRIPLNCLTYRTPPDEIANSVNTRAGLQIPFSLHSAFNLRFFKKQTPNRHCLTRSNVDWAIPTWCQSWIAQCCLKRTVKREGLGLGNSCEAIFPYTHSSTVWFIFPLMYFLMYFCPIYVYFLIMPLGFSYSFG